MQAGSDSQATTCEQHEDARHTSHAFAFDDGTHVGGGGLELPHCPWLQKFAQHSAPVVHVEPSGRHETGPPQAPPEHVPLQHWDDERHGTPSTWQVPVSNTSGASAGPASKTPLLDAPEPVLPPLLVPLLPPLPPEPLVLPLPLPPASPAPRGATAPPQAGASVDDAPTQIDNASEARARRMDELPVRV